MTILRDPVERVHSYFDYLVAGDDPSMPGRVSRRERLIVQDGFDSFIDRVPVDGLLNQLAMFSDRLDVHEAADRIGACSSVFFTEDFSAGLAELGTPSGATAGPLPGPGDHRAEHADRAATGATPGEVGAGVRAARPPRPGRDRHPGIGRLGMTVAGQQERLSTTALNSAAHS